MNRIIWPEIHKGNNLHSPVIPESIMCIQDGCGMLYLNLKDVAFALGLTRPQRNSKDKKPTYVRWDRLKKYLSQIIHKEIKEGLDAFTFITEEEYYQLLFHVETKQAMKLQKLALNEFKAKVSTEDKLKIFASILSAAK